MKTSTTQFEMMVNFMEVHGDLNKPTNNARGRIGTIQSWETLTNLLNGDPTGESKPTDKWKKVWSDLKNNTKKKAAKINRAVIKTGGGPALLAKLSDLEQRVLNIIGPQAATGLHGVMEAGFSQELTVDPDRTITLTQTPPRPASVPVSPVIFTYPIESENIEVADDVWNQPGPSHHPHIPPPSNDGNVTPAAEVDRPITPAVDNPASRGQTPRRRRDAHPRSLASPRRRRRAETQTEQAARHFLATDREWREFLKSKHEDEMRVRERELETQKRWQEICVYAIETIDKILKHNTKT